MRKGMLLTISAPSGTGKSTLINMLMEKHPEFSFSVSYTTRSPRQGEVEGKDYFFTQREKFLSLKDQGFFAEWAEVHGNFYGTPRQKVLDALESGQSLIFDIDVQGASQLKKNLNTGLFLFIFPPSLKVLEKRLVNRGTDDLETIKKRIHNAKQEISLSHMFDFWLINDDLGQAFAQLEALVSAEKMRPVYKPDLPKTVLNNTWSQDHE
ncbi:guanylate kinase [Desulfonatronovibrio hydrogenovorans]|uniref:guanylate kinase n=1 Tax=Desulfonatronovibrio hydrogenovorans TaxID=53245 RepID=UPI00048E051E|nr:guanylate kinase [Desulfonatronovibrio hydrogenovorans]